MSEKIAVIGAGQMGGGIAHVAALRETSVIFAAVIGAKLLHEPLGARRIAAACVVAIGMMLMRLH